MPWRGRLGRAPVGVERNHMRYKFALLISLLVGCHNPNPPPKPPPGPVDGGSGGTAAGGTAAATGGQLATGGTVAGTGGATSTVPLRVCEAVRANLLQLQCPEATTTSKTEFMALCQLYTSDPKYKYNAQCRINAKTKADAQQCSKTSCR